MQLIGCFAMRDSTFRRCSLLESESQRKWNNHGNRNDGENLRESFEGVELRRGSGLGRYADRCSAVQYKSAATIQNAANPKEASDDGSRTGPLPINDSNSAIAEATKPRAELFIANEYFISLSGIPLT